MIVVSAAVLVINFWEIFPPFLQVIFIFALPTSFYAAGWLTRSRLKLVQAGMVLTGSGAILLAVDFAALYQFSNLNIDLAIYWLVAALACTAIYIFTALRLQGEFFDYLALLGSVNIVLALTRLVRLPLVEWSSASIPLASTGIICLAGWSRKKGVKKGVEDFVRSKVGPSDSLMLVAAGQGMRVYQPPTRDAAVFLESLSRVGATEEPASLLRFGEELDAVLRSARNMDLPPEWVTRNAYNLGREHLQREEQLTQASFDSAIALVKEIGTLPGRKNIVFYSAGHRLKIGPAIQEAIQEALKEAPPSGRGGRTASSAAAPPAPSDSSSLQIRSLLGTMTSMEKLDSFLRRLIDEANRAQVSFYAIDARALMTEQDIRIRGTSPYSEKLMREEIAQPQDFLRALAAGTGGRSFLYTNNLGLGISSAYLDLARHYELGYVPAGELKPGTLHKITLNVLRPDLQVSYRHAFVEPLPCEIPFPLWFLF